MPDVLREAKPLRKGRPPTSPKSLDLLRGKTISISPGESTGSFYTLAKNHGKVAHTGKRILNKETVIVVWFDDK